MTETSEPPTDTATTEIAESTPPQSKSRLRRYLPVGVAIAGLVVAAAVATHSTLTSRDLTDREHARADALRAACDYAPVLADYDAKNIDAYFRQVLAGATGAWQQEFDSTSKDLRDVLIQGQVTSKAGDIQCAIKSSGPTDAQALVAITQTITSAGTSGQPHTGQLTIALSLQQTGGRWLVNKVDSPLIPRTSGPAR
ncbi:hypothetical protein OHB26_24910 [Nocardia sp. NBC_01503]|uniref:hypothetical protein n=1 Tax=Nocardia sp. NBC_01503 TaxID=2975997 RepID=UPI002E7BEB1C|nr:hypothetical protein [Nocardia sp. NBC_01503]WTL30177.1 hypothetical protein OHB26_24910 [Nocardia sp. NBC_01503]